MRKPGILMIVENHFPGDPRVRKEAEALLGGYDITVISLKKVDTDKFHEVQNGIRIFRLPEFPSMRLGKIRYILEYVYFTLAASILFVCTHPFLRFKVIHVHNPPDTLFAVGILGKLVGVRFVFDHHDLSPELYLTRFSGRRDLPYRLLLLCEKLSCKVADMVISTNESYKRIDMGRNAVKEDQIFIVRNNPIISDCTVPASGAKTGPTEKARAELLFLGSINPQDGLDTLLHALHFLVNNLGEKGFICRVVGGGDSVEDLKILTAELKLQDYVVFVGMVYDRNKVREYLCGTDIGLEPAPANPLNVHSTFIKVMEYMAAAKPIVAFDLFETRYSAGGSAILVPAGDVEGYARAIKELMSNQERRERLGALGMQRVMNELTWQKASAVLVEAYKTLRL